jgi:two-component system sensor histidine kinase KdpD
VETGEAFSHPALWHDDTWGDGSHERRAFAVRATKYDDGFVVIYHEVSDDVVVGELRELALEEERSRSQELRDLDASRFSLMAAVTHDLRTPLAGIVGLSWLLESDWESMAEETRREYVRDIVRSGEDLDRRITSVLEHLKVETGRYEVDLEVCDVGEELAGAIDRMALMLESYRIVFDVPEDTPVWADRTAFARVAENLLSNAVKYSPEGTSVTVRAERVESAVVVSVIDEGPGISEEDAQRVFQQFERLESGRRVAHGNGVGLSAVRQLVELMDGKVWVEPNAGRGSAFRFALPLAA